jgi:hypothetical protein
MNTSALAAASLMIPRMVTPPLAPDSFTIADHFVSSRSISAAYSAGVVGKRLGTIAMMRARTSFSASAGVQRGH